MKSLPGQLLFGCLSIAVPMREVERHRFAPEARNSLVLRRDRSGMNGFDVEAGKRLLTRNSAGYIKVASITPIKSDSGWLRLLRDDGLV